MPRVANHGEAKKAKNQCFGEMKTYPPMLVALGAEHERQDFISRTRVSDTQRGQELAVECVGDSHEGPDTNGGRVGSVVIGPDQQGMVLNYENVEAMCGLVETPSDELATDPPTCPTRNSNVPSP